MNEDSTVNQTRSSAEMPLILRAAPIVNVKESDRTIGVTWTAGALVRRYDYQRDRYYFEELVQDDSALRMARLQSGKAPFLDGHSTYSLTDVLGVIESAVPPSEGGTAVVRFSKRADVEPIFQDVKDKILTSVSVGARVYRMEMVAPDENNKDWIYRATDWEPYEISLVPIGADPGSTVRSEGQAAPTMYDCECITVTRQAASNPPAATKDKAAAASQPQKGSTMTIEHIAALQRAADDANAALASANTTATTRAAPIPQHPVHQSQTQSGVDAVEIERKRVKDIRDAVRASTLDNKHSLIDSYIDNGAAADVVRAEVLNQMAQRSQANEPRAQGGSRIETVTDESDTRREAMINAISHRVAPSTVKLTDPGRVYRGMSLREMCREGLEAVGVSTRGMGMMDLAGTALGISNRGYMGATDLPLIFGSVINRTMRQAYIGSPKTFTTWARQGSLPDFRPITRAVFDAALKFDKMGASGEYKYGSFSDGGETIQLATYSKAIAFNRQMIINDDLSALERIPMFFGRAAADMESDIVYGVLTGNANLTDGLALFEAGTHKNLTGAGTKITVDALSIGRAAMRVQAAPGGSVLNLAPKYLIVPAAQETLAQQYTSNQYTPTKSVDRNIFEGVLTPVVEARLDAVSTTAWYLVGDQAQIDTVEYCYLDGEEGLYIEQGVDFDVDGLKVKGRVDFAAKAIDYRGLYKNVGA